jgi:hypothetical protein
LAELVYFKPSEERIGCDIYVLGRRNGKLFDYKFRDGLSRPLSLTEVASGVPLKQAYNIKSCKIKVIPDQRDIYWYFPKTSTSSLLCECRKEQYNPMVRIEKFRPKTVRVLGYRYISRILEDGKISNPLSKKTGDYLIESDSVCAGDLLGRVEVN